MPRRARNAATSWNQSYPIFSCCGSVAKCPLVRGLHSLERNQPDPLSGICHGGVATGSQARPRCSQPADHFDRVLLLIDTDQHVIQFRAEPLLGATFSMRELVEAVFVPVDVVREYTGWSNTWKAHGLALTERLLDDPRVRRVPPQGLSRTLLIGGLSSNAHRPSRYALSTVSGSRWSAIHPANALGFNQFAP